MFVYLCFAVVVFYFIEKPQGMTSSITIILLKEMVRKVTEKSFAWQWKTFKTTSRLYYAEQGVEDVLKQGMGTQSWAAVVGRFGRLT